MKVYAVYSIPKSPEYRLEKLFKTKEGAKKYIEEQKCGNSNESNRLTCIPRRFDVFDIQIEEIQE